MKKVSSLLLLAIVFFSACNTPASFKKGKDNLEYKIIADGSGPKIQYGNYMQLAITTYYNTGKKDSLLNDTRTSGRPIIELLDSISTPQAYFEILKQLRKGDSVAIRVLSDSAFKSMPDQMPPFIKKGHYLITAIKVINILTTKGQADSTRNAAMVLMQQKDSISAIAQMAKDDKILTDYLAKHNIKAEKSPKGTYVEIINPGAGNNIDTSVVAKINYTGRTLSNDTLDSVPFDSNTDPSKGPREPLTVNMTSDPSLGRGVIKGWTDGLKLLKKGAKAKFYIPSSLAYGSQGGGGPIGPNAILMFDIDVVDVLSKEKVLADMKMQSEKMEAMRKHYMDSVAKTQKPAVTK